MTRRWTAEEAWEYGHRLPIYDSRTGKPVPSRTEWEQYSRWRRWRDWLLGYDPPKNFRREC
jgi:hypothetical protein